MGFRLRTDDDRREAEIEHDKIKDKVLGDLKKTFRPEFLNRIDQVVVFRPLSRSDIYQILNLQLARLSERLAEQGISLKVATAAKNFLVDRGYDLEQGARPMRRAIQDYIEDPLAQAILAGQFKTGATVSILHRADQPSLYLLEASTAKAS